MDWTQASWIEVFIFNLGMLFIGLICMLVIGAVLVFVYDFARDRIAHIRQMKQTTRALRCDACDFNVEGVGDGARKCERFGHSITGAPVRRPGCSWGMRWKEGGDD